MEVWKIVFHSILEIFHFIPFWHLPYSIPKFPFHSIPCPANHTYGVIDTTMLLVFHVDKINAYCTVLSVTLRNGCFKVCQPFNWRQKNIIHLIKGFSNNGLQYLKKLAKLAPRLLRRFFSIDCVFIFPLRENGCGAGFGMYLHSLSICHMSYVKFSADMTLFQLICCCFEVIKQIQLLKRTYPRTQQRDRPDVSWMHRLFSFGR